MLETFVPRSSNLDRVDYDDTAQKLTITFKDGAAYIYSGVPHTVFLGLQNAPSAGQYFHRQIKERYSYEEI